MNKLREEIARIIDPVALYETWKIGPIPGMPQRRDEAWAKADQIIAAWNRRADPLVEELRGALERLAREVFGSQAGDEPDVYADYDKLIELERLTREALALPVGGGSSREPAQATQVSSDPTANADGWTPGPFSVGFEGSQARLEQEDRIATEDALRAAVQAALAQPDPLTETSGRVDGSSVAESTGAGPDGPGACDAQCQSEGGAS